MSGVRTRQLLLWDCCELDAHDALFKSRAHDPGLRGRRVRVRCTVSGARGGVPSTNSHGPHVHSSALFKRASGLPCPPRKRPPNPRRYRPSFSSRACCPRRAPRVSTTSQESPCAGPTRSGCPTLQRQPTRTESANSAHAPAIASQPRLPPDPLHISQSQHPPNDRLPSPSHAPPTPRPLLRRPLPHSSGTGPAASLLTLPPDSSHPTLV